MNLTTVRDFTAEFLTARRAFHASTDLTTRFAAEDASIEVSDAAYDAGVRIDEIELDEQARLEVVA